MTSLPIQLVSFSAQASAQTSAGHFFWMYSYLFEKLSSVASNNGLTIGASDQEAPFIIGHLPRQMPGRFRVTPLTLLRYRLPRLFRIVRDLAESGVTHLQFYDGGLLELLISLQLAKRNPKLTVVYNFHWADDWLRLFQHPKAVSSVLSVQIFRHLRNRPPNLIVSAETSKLANRLNAFLGFTPATYPIMAFFDPPTTKPWHERNTDVLVIPQRSSQLVFSSEILALAKSRKLTARAFLNEVLWLDFQSLSGANGNKKDVVMGPLESTDFINLLADARLVILPYDKPYFEWGSSGKFNEAVALGAFPFAPAGTAIAHQSTLNPDEHYFDPSDLEAAWGVLVDRLASGFPQGLVPTTFHTYIDWLASCDQTEHRAPTLAPEGRDLTLWVAALLYRPQGPGYVRRLRARLGATLDRHIKLWTRVE